jgi:hypothetical protein
MSSTRQLLEANLAVFGQRDADIRRDAIRETYCEDVVFVDPEGTVFGHHALNEKVEHLLTGLPDVTFSKVGPMYESGDLALQAWSLGRPGENAVAHGIDVIEIREGLVSRLSTLLATD